jgi:hypothetical protein
MSASWEIEAARVTRHMRTYTQLMMRARGRPGVPGVRYERHHMLPRSLGGPDIKPNVVRLTPREHYIAHLLLPEFTGGEHRWKMLCALKRFVFSKNPAQYRIKSRDYERIVAGQREAIGSLLRGRKHTAEARANMAAAQKKRFAEQRAAGIPHHNIGRKPSEETRQKKRLACPRPKGWKHTEEARRRISEASKRTFSAEARANMALAQKAVWASGHRKKPVARKVKPKQAPVAKPLSKKHQMILEIFHAVGRRSELAARFGVHRSTIRRIKTGMAYAALTSGAA